MMTKPTNTRYTLLATAYPSSQNRCPTGGRGWLALTPKTCRLTSPVAYSVDFWRRLGISRKSDRM